MGIPGSGTAFFSILKVFFFLVVLYFFGSTILLMIITIDEDITAMDAMIANIVPIVSMTSFYASGIINGIYIGISE